MLLNFCTLNIITNLK